MVSILRATILPAKRATYLSIMRTSHTRLLQMYYDPKYDFHQVSVDYINRGAPGNRSTIEGDCIRSLESWGMEIQSDTGIAFIPYHRILRIQYEGDLIWERGMREQLGHKKAPDNNENENLA